LIAFSLEKQDLSYRFFNLRSKSMIPDRNQSISFLELILTALILTSSLILLEKYWLNNSLAPRPTINVQSEQLK